MTVDLTDSVCAITAIYDQLMYRHIKLHASIHTQKYPTHIDRLRYNITCCKYATQKSTNEKSIRSITIFEKKSRRCTIDFKRLTELP